MICEVYPRFQLLTLWMGLRVFEIVISSQYLYNEFYKACRHYYLEPFLWHSEVFGQMSSTMTSKWFDYTILEILPSHSSTQGNRGQLLPHLW